MEMVSFQVMINSLQRLLRRKSTYIFGILIPIILACIGGMTERITSNQITVGVYGSKDFYEIQKSKLETMEHISCIQAKEKSMHADYIMGEYDYLLLEGNHTQEDILSAVGAFNQKPTNNPISQQMLGMLLLCYMTITVHYASGLIDDRKEKRIERFLCAGCHKISYIAGYLEATLLITGIQILFIFVAWQIFMPSFELSVSKSVITYGFILLVSNVYAMLIVLTSKSGMSAGLKASSIAVILSLVGGVFLPYETLPSIIRAIGMLSPMRWLIQIL